MIGMLGQLFNFQIKVSQHLGYHTRPSMWSVVVSCSLPGRAAPTSLYVK